MATGPVGDLYTSDIFPSGAELSRRYPSFSLCQATGTAPLVAIPTTTTAFELYNNTASVGTESYLIIDSIFSFRLLGTAAGFTWGLWGCVASAKAAPTGEALNLGSLAGKPTRALLTAGDSLLVGRGTTVIANGWRPWGVATIELHTESAVPQGTLAVDVFGKMIVPPSAALCLHAVANTATGTNVFGASGWIVPATEFKSEF